MWRNTGLISEFTKHWVRFVKIILSFLLTLKGDGHDFGQQLFFLFLTMLK